MIPTVDERLASVVRALSEVVLPHLPPDASLAQEQVQLCIGHLQILRGQIDHAPDFERGELQDAALIGRELVAAASGGPATTAAVAALSTTIGAADHGAAIGEVRSARAQIHQAIDTLVSAVSADGTADSRTALSAIVLRHEAQRSLKDRQWFAPYGFDTLSD